MLSVEDHDAPPQKTSGAADGSRGLRGRLFSGVSWSIAAAVIDRLLALALSVFLARLLGREGFGKYGILLATAMMFSLASAAGLGVSATRLVGELRDSEKERLGRILALLTLTAAVCAVLLVGLLLSLSAVLAEHALKAAELTNALRIIILAVIPLQFISVSRGVLVGLEAFDKAAWSRLCAGVARAGLVLAGAHVGGLLGAVSMVTLAHLVELAVLYIFQRRPLRRHGIRAGSPHSAWRERKVLYSVLLPASLTGQLRSPFNWLSLAILAWQPGGYAALGVFNAANQWRMLVLFLPGRVRQVSLPILSNLLGSGDMRRFRKLVWMNLGFALAAGGVVAGGVAVAGRLIMPLYGMGFEEGRSVLVVLVAAAVMRAISNSLDVALLSLGKMWSIAASEFVRGLSLVVASLVLVPGHLATGLAFALVIADGLKLGVSAMLVIKYLHVAKPSVAKYVSYDTTSNG